MQTVLTGMTAGSAGDVLTFTFDNGVSATTVTLTNSAGYPLRHLTIWLLS